MVKMLDSGPSLSRQGRLREAAAVVESALAADPSDAETRLTLARVHLRAGHARRALSVLSGAEDVGRTSPGLALAMRLEALWAELLSGHEVEAVLGEARRLMRDAQGSAIDRDRLVARAVGLRLESAAANFELLTKPQKAAVLAELQTVRQALDGLSEADDAYACSVAGLHLAPLEEREAALLRLVDETQVSGRPDLAADASARLAELRLGAGAHEAGIRSALQMARDMAARSGHVLVPLDANRIEARLRIDRSHAPLSELEDVLAAYRAHDVPARLLDTEIALSSLAHRAGDTAAAGRYRQEAIDIANAAGLAMFLVHADLAAADLFVRSGDTSLAAAVCQDGLARPIPRPLQGAFHLIKASPHGFDGDVGAARRAIEAAMRVFEQIGRADLLANARRVYLGYRVAEGNFAGLIDTAIAWAKDDERRGDAESAVASFETVAEIRMAQYRASQGGPGEPPWLDLAVPHLDRAQALTAQLAGKVQAQRLGGVQQHRGMLATHRRDARAARGQYLAAAGTFADAGLAMEAANSRLMAGLLAQDMARDTQTAGHGGESLEDLLIAADTDYEQAMDYYRSSMMRRDIARVLLQRARLRVQARAAVPPEAAARLRAEALELLAEADSVLDELRAGLVGRTSEGAWRGRRAVIGQASDVHALALGLLAERPGEAPLLWSWLQRSKARSLGDILALKPLRQGLIEQQVSRRADLGALLTEESTLVAALQGAPAAESPGLRTRLAETRGSMSRHPELAEIAEQRSGRPPSLESVQALLKADDGQRKVLVDWFEANGRFGILATTADGPPAIAWLPPPLATRQSVNAALEALGEGYFRRPDALARLASLAPLISPLAHLSRPGDHLILSPSRELGTIPLHALALGAEPLLRRNTISYSASVSLLTAAVARGSAPAPGGIAVFADPTGDSPASLRAGQEIAALWGIGAVTAARATGANFTAGLRQARLSHYQGHAGLDRRDPLLAHLALADGPLTAAGIMDCEAADGATAVIVACEAGAATAGKGTEQMGLPIALMLAGAASVVAPLWPVQEDDAAGFSILLHRRLRELGATSLAKVLQDVQLQLMRDGATVQGWAPYVLHGRFDRADLAALRDPAR